MSTRGTILIVDDDEDNIGLLGVFFEDLGFTAKKFEKTAPAKKWLATNVPALIFLDIMMPDGNGLDMCKWIRSQPNIETVPILVSSGLYDEETVQDALENGASDFIPKPHRLDDLRERVERALKEAG